MYTEHQDPTENPGDLQSGEGEPGLQQYLGVLIKRKLLIFTAFFLVLGGVAVWTYTQTRVYRAIASVIVDRRAPQVLGKDVGEVIELSTGTYWSNKEYMKTQENVITSKRMAHKVVERHRLLHNPKFWATTNVIKAPKASEGQKKVERTMEMAATRLRALTNASTVRDSNILEISVEHSLPEMAAKLANAVSTEYLTEGLDYKALYGNKASKWLHTKMDTLKTKLDAAEDALFAYKKKNNIISVSLENRQTLINRRIERLNDALNDIRIKRMSVEARRTQLLAARKQKPMEMSFSPVLDNGTIQNLKDSYIKEQRGLAALSESKGYKHPEVRKQVAKVDIALKDLEREVKAVLASVAAQYQEVRETEGKLAAELNRAKKEAMAINGREIDYNRLKREAENTSKLYSVVLSRWKESSLSSQLPFSNVRPLDAAVENARPIRPRVSLNMVLGGILGLLLGIALAFVVETMDRTVKTQVEIDQVPGLPYLGMVPKIPGSQRMREGKRRPASNPEVDLIVHRNSGSTVAEQCRSIRTNLMFASTDTKMEKILVSSAGPREGKTTTAVNLAITMAQAGSRVLLVDTDMRRPRLHRIFGVANKTGVTTILTGDAAIEEVVKDTEVPGLYLLASGITPPNPAELCQSEKFRQLLDDLAERYDRVILDSPPIMLVTDAVILSTLVNGAVIVARSGTTSRVALTEATRYLLDVGSKVLGCILNDFDLEKRGYGYYRYSRYGYYRYGNRYQPYGHSDGEEEASS